LGIRTSEIVAGFYSFLGLTRLVSSTVVSKAVVRGVSEGVFAYTGAASTLGPDNRYQVSASKVRHETTIAQDEVDLESGFVMLPKPCLLPLRLSLKPACTSWPYTARTRASPATSDTDGESDTTGLFSES